MTAENFGSPDSLPAAPGIDKDQPIAVYLQLKNLLLAEIVRGKYNAGDRLPTEHELCAMYDISRTPVSRALFELAEQGVVIRHRKRGTFVSAHWAQRAPNVRELRVVVPEGTWADVLRRVAPGDTALNVVSVELGDLHQYLISAVAAGRAPDLALLDSVWVREFAEAGFLMPLDELGPEWIADEYRAEFAAPFVDATSVAGHVVGVQAEADVAGLWYRRDAVAQSGGAVPATWDGLRRACQSVAARFNYPYVFPGGSRSGEAATYCLVALLASNGSSVMTGEAVTLSNPRTVECMEFLAGLVADGLAPVEVTRYPREWPIGRLASGRAAFCAGGSYEGPALAAAAGVASEELWNEFGFAPFPSGVTGPQSNITGGMVYVIFRQAARPELAMHVVRHAATTDALVHMSRQTGQLPPRWSALRAVADDSELLATTTTMLDKAIARPRTSSYARVSEQLQAMIERVIAGKRDPADAVHHTAEMIGAITGMPLA